MSPMSRPRIQLLTVGGTIAMSPGAGGGLSPALGAADLLHLVPELGDGLVLELADVHAKPSADLSFADLAEVASRIEGAFAAGADGVVVTQGTDTLEEAAFLLELLLPRLGPVVVTGAMRSPSGRASDAAPNLIAAVRVAASPDSRDLGVLVVMNDEIHAARFVHKSHASNLAAFTSAPLGPLGWVAEGRPRIVMRVDRLPRFAWRGEPPRVMTLPVDFGMEAPDVDELRAKGFAGVVVAAFGAGHVPSAAVPALATLAERMPVVLASRTGQAGGLRQTYGFPGSETDLLSRGLISAGWLDGRKARVLLAQLLAQGLDRSGIERVFDQL